MSPNKQRRTHEEVKEGMRQFANGQRDIADEAAAMFGGCDDMLHPFGLDNFRDYNDFIERVARPLVEADGDDEITQKVMVLYRKMSPFSICVSMVMLQNQIDRLEWKEQVR